MDQVMLSGLVLVIVVGLCALWCAFADRKERQED